MKRLKDSLHAQLRFRLWILIISILMMLSFMSQSFSESKTHDLGKFKFMIEARDNLNTNDYPPDGNGGSAWPQDHFRYWQVQFYNPLFIIGSWRDAAGNVYTKDEIKFPLRYNSGEGYGIFEYRRHEPPEVWVYTQDELQLSSPKFSGVIDPSIPSDQMIEVHYKAYPGFDVLKRSYSFANANHDDYIIFYNRYLCTFDWDEDPEPDAPTDQTMQSVYIGYGYSFNNAEGTYITYCRWFEEAKDDWATYEAYGPQIATAGRDLHITFGWDGDHPDITEFEVGGQAFDDTGDPRFAIGDAGENAMPSGEFVSAEYAGFAALHVDRSASDHSDDLTQPTAIMTNMNIYNFWNFEFPGFATAWDWATSGYRQTVEDQSGWPNDATCVEAEMPFQAFGPYDFQLGDSVVIVYAVAVNGISRELAIEKGLEWRDWYRGGLSTFDNEAKNALLATGKDSLFQSLDRALWAWQNDLKIPAPLPSPDLTVTSGPDVVYLEWEDMSQTPDPNTNVADLDHYNIYRKMGAYLVDTYDELNAQGNHLIWEKIAEVSGDVTKYTDSAVVRGESYHYAVTAVDDGSQNTDGIYPGQPLESSVYSNRSEIPAIPFKPSNISDNAEEFPFSYSLDQNQPNPFNPKTTIKFQIPSSEFATLKIYNALGEEVSTLISNKLHPGSHSYIFDAKNLASGIYYYQLVAGNYVQTRKMIYLK